ncbi:M24 family metallopeptidase [Paenibacillus sp. CAU 1782]
MNAQEIAIRACQESKPFLVPGISEKAFSNKCEEVMYSLGAEGLWYPMLVNFNKNSIYCTQGAHLPSDEVILQDSDIVLIDFSPMLKGRWGDYSETIVVGHDQMFNKLVEDAKYLFEQTYSYAKECRTVGELFQYCNEIIQKSEYKLLDPYGNIGHSIEDYNNHDKRIFISPENFDVPLKGRRWAIEPHIGIEEFGAKFENVITIE